MTLIQKLVSIYVAYQSFACISNALAAESAKDVSLLSSNLAVEIPYHSPSVIFSRQQSSYTLYSHDFKELYSDNSAYGMCKWAKKNHSKNSRDCFTVRVDMADGTTRFYSYVDFCHKVSSLHTGDVPLPLEFNIDKYCRLR